MVRFVEGDIFIKRFKKRRGDSGRKPILEEVYAGHIRLERGEKIICKIGGEVNELKIPELSLGSDGRSIFCLADYRGKHIRFVLPIWHPHLGDMPSSDAFTGQSPEAKGKYMPWSAHVVRICRGE